MNNYVFINVIELINILKSFMIIIFEIVNLLIVENGVFVEFILCYNL